MDPWKSWAVVGVVGAGAAYYYSQSGKTKRGRDRISSLQAEQIHRQASDSRNDSKDARKKKGKGKISDSSDRAASDAAEASSASVPTSSSNGTKKRRGDKQHSSRLAQSSVVDASNEHGVKLDDGEAEDDEMSNKEFATQLMGLKKGTSLKKPDTNDKQIKKTGKQGKGTKLQSNVANGTFLKPNGASDLRDLSTASSTTGADADDDLSLPVSPDLGAVQTTTPSGGDVSDMLEAPAKGPSILRIASSGNPQPAKQSKSKKSNPEPETKKQRQNRQKNEEKKAAREQAEMERRVLLEKQLRTAREAEGRPAKNGLSASKAPTTNAWDTSAGSSAEASAPVLSESSKPDAGGLLDTFDEDQSFLGQHAPQVNGDPSSGDTKGEKTQNHDLPSEEEQMKLINEMDSSNAWSTVTKGGKGKKKSTKSIPTNESNIAEGSTVTSSNNDNVLFKDHLPSANGSASSKAQDQIVPGRKQTLPKNPVTLSSDDLQNPTADSEDIVSPSLLHEAPENAKDTDSDLIAAPADRNQPNKTANGVEVDQDRPKDQLGDRAYRKDSTRSRGVPPAVSKRWRAIAKTLDHSIWNYNNIHEHPEYDPDWPYALTGHPMDSDWAGDWDSDDMRKSNEKRAKEEASQNAAKKAERQSLK